MEDFEEMEMPTPCQHCGDWFDLNDGYGSEKWYPNVIICEKCHDQEEDEIRKDEEIEDYKAEIEDYEYNLIRVRKRLLKLGEENPSKIDKLLSYLDSERVKANEHGKSLSQENKFNEAKIWYSIAETYLDAINQTKTIILEEKTEENER